MAKQNETKSDEKTNGERAVIVTTEHRGVFFGYAKEIIGPN